MSVGQRKKRGTYILNETVNLAKQFLYTMYQIEVVSDTADRTALGLVLDCVQNGTPCRALIAKDGTYLITKLGSFTKEG